MKVERKDNSVSKPIPGLYIDEDGDLVLAFEKAPEDATIVRVMCLCYKNETVADDKHRGVYKQTLNFLRPYEGKVTLSNV